MPLLLILILIQLVPPVLSVFIYERIKGYTLPTLKRVVLYLLFVVAINAFGYATLLLLGQVYHEWLLYDLNSSYGLPRRLVIPFASAVVLPFALYYYKKLKDRFAKDEDFDKKVVWQYGHFSFVLFTTSFIVFVFSPTYIAVNANMFIQSTIVLTVTLAIAGASMLLGVGVFFLRDNYKYLEALISGLLVLCYLNAFIFPFQAEILDGMHDFANIQSNPLPFIRNALALIILSGLWIVFRKQLRFTVILLLLLAFVLTFINVHGMSSVQPDIDENTLATEEVFESASTFSSERNVIVIVMDMMQGSIVERTFSEYPQLLDSFDGFTVFSRAFTSFPFTYFSTSTIHSGKLYPSENPTREANTLQSYEDSFMLDMRNEGLHVNLLGDIDGVGHSGFPYAARILIERPWAIYNTVSSASLARVTGYWMQSPFTIFNSSRTKDWEGSSNEIFYDQMANDIEMMEKLINDFSVTDEEKKLLYFWNFGTHTPVITTKDGQFDLINIGQRENFELSYLEETYFFLMQLSRLFKAMKEYGVYDNSLIIITSDHGTGINDEMILEHGKHMEDFVDGIMWFENIRPVHMYNAVMMVKPPSSRGEAIITHDPAWNGDVRELVNRYFTDFTNIPPIDMMADIRADTPEVGVMFAAIGSSHADMLHSSENHEIVYVRSLHEIAAAFSALSGITYD